MLFGIEEKLSKLIRFLNQSKKVAIAFSGGVDSSFLARMAFDALGENSVALTADSIFMPRSELDEAEKLAEKIGIQHVIVNISDLDDKVLANTPQRCYLCKKVIFETLLTHLQRLF